MKTKFRTTFKCSGCVENATPHLDEVVGADNWSVDLESPEKVLIVTKEDVTEDQVIEAVKKAGYSVERIR